MLKKSFDDSGVALNKDIQSKNGLQFVGL